MEMLTCSYSRLRCHKCKEDMVIYIPKELSGIYNQPRDVKKARKKGLISIIDENVTVNPRKILKMTGKRYYCFNCGGKFDDIQSLAIVDGIFLDKNKDMRKRSMRYVVEFCNELKLSDDVKKGAIAILTDFNRMWGYRNFAGASIYIASILYEQRETQYTMSDVSKSSTLSLGRAGREICEKLDITLFDKAPYVYGYHSKEDWDNTFVDKILKELDNEKV